MDNTETRIARHLQHAHSDSANPRRNPDVDYFERFAAFDKFMNNKIHDAVNTGAAAAGSGWLTDHGRRHVATVIRRIDDLTHTNNGCILTPYESYLILLAAHVHDVGNVAGREDHEKRAKDVLFQMDSAYVGNDNVEKRMIYDIAMAHGGRTDHDGSRDTIRRLHHDRRIKLLAATLRFADEIADDNTRTTRFVTEQVQAVAPESSVYHMYADRLCPPQIDHEGATIRLTFELLEEHLTNRYNKGGTDVYLLDEILERTLKTHREQVYCAKFMTPDILFERIEVQVLVCTENYADVVGTVAYVLEQTGYPLGIDDIARLAPELSGLSGWSAAQSVSAVLGRHLNSPRPHPRPNSATISRPHQCRPIAY